MDPSGAGDLIGATKPLNRSCTEHSPSVKLRRVMPWEWITNKLFSFIHMVRIPVVHEVTQCSPLTLPLADLLERESHGLIELIVVPIWLIKTMHLDIPPCSSLYRDHCEKSS